MMEINHKNFGHKMLYFSNNLISNLLNSSLFHFEDIKRVYIVIKPVNGDALLNALQNIKRVYIVIKLYQIYQNYTKMVPCKGFFNKHTFHLQ